MTLSQLLPVEAVRTVSAVSSKKRLFNALSEAVGQVYQLPADEVCAALMERESLGPTGVGQGVALPHARLAGLDQVRGLFMKLERPLDFGSVDRQPVDLVFGLFAPAGAGVEHLKALAKVSRALRNPDLCAKLRANDDALTLHALLTERNESRAA